MGIRIRNDQAVISLDGEQTSYIIGIDEQYGVLHLYWGRYIRNLEDFELAPLKGLSTFEGRDDLLPEEFSGWGGLRYKEPSLKVSFADGTRDVRLFVQGLEADGDILTITFRDARFSLEAVVKYQTFKEQDMIKRSVAIYNKEDSSLMIEQLFSGEWNFKEGNFRLTNVSGKWAAENAVFRKEIPPGKMVLEGRKGITGHNHSPYFMLDRQASPDTGDVFFGALAYSGNFKIEIEKLPFGSTRVLAGMNDFDSRIELASGASFESPEVYFGFTQKGHNGASQALHSFARNFLIPQSHRSTLRPVLYNSWEAVRFEVAAENQALLAERAAEIGVELFVVDDGWFKNRNSSAAGLGDWYPDEKKFPKGLAPLIDKVTNLGMKFGIWIEPEMVNRDSYLYRMHPDWVYRFETREGTLSRNQLVLDLTKEEVRNYLLYALDHLLTKYDISFVKWDMNRPISEPGALNLPEERRQEIWFLHNKYVFELIRELRKRHPDVLWEGCASGGGRVNFEAIQYFDQFWPSDNTDALERLTIQSGFSYAYPVKTMSCWVTDSPNSYTKRVIPIQFRCHAAMLGAFAIGSNLTGMSGSDLLILKKSVSEYKRIRSIVQEGELHRMETEEKNFLGFQYMKENRAVIFVFKHGGGARDPFIRLKFKALEPARNYCVALEGKILFIKSGDYLLYEGIKLSLNKEYDSRMFEIFPKMGYLYRGEKKNRF
ncbi:alpha-galactosidase [Peribacillus sp. SCS-26]|uniref:alpha-galactosidase n=1 Tax=Paraperibacillus marinus TaxID=3115295 RepID=UPI0039065069